MLREDLVNEILDYIRTLYKAEYTGRIEVQQNDDTYSLLMGIPSYMTPTTTFYTATSDNKDDEFLNYIYEDLRVRNYMKLDKYRVVRTPYVKEE